MASPLATTHFCPLYPPCTPVHQQGERGERRPGQGGAGKAQGQGPLSLSFPPGPQFVCVECLVTASVDMFPRQLRRSGRRELLILAISILCYLIGLLLVTEVSRGGACG